MKNASWFGMLSMDIVVKMDAKKFNGKGAGSLLLVIFLYNDSKVLPQLLLANDEDEPTTVGSAKMIIIPPFWIMIPYIQRNQLTPSLVVQKQCQLFFSWHHRDSCFGHHQTWIFLEKTKIGFLRFYFSNCISRKIWFIVISKVESQFSEEKDTIWFWGFKIKLDLENGKFTSINHSKK